MYQQLRLSLAESIGCYRQLLVTGSPAVPLHREVSMLATQYQT